MCDDTIKIRSPEEVVKTVSKIEKELNEIRLQIYEETKDMTPHERCEYYRRHGETITKEYGFKSYSSAEEAELDRR